MLIRLFTVLLFFLFSLVWCELFLVTCAADTDGSSNTVAIFEAGKIKVLEKPGDTELELYIRSIQSSLLVAADGVMVALATMGNYDQTKVNVDVLARNIETEGDDWVNKTTALNGINWETQLVMEKKEGWDYIFTLRNPVAIVKDNEIYLLIVNYRRALTRNGHWKYVQWDFELAVGEVRFKNNTRGAGKTIEWKASESLNTTLTRQFKDKLLTVPPHGGLRSAFLTENGEVVFVARASKGVEGGSAIIRLKNTTGTREWEVSYIGAVDNCHPYFFFEWEQKIVVFVFCLSGDHKLRESTDGGRTWVNCTGTLSFLSNQLRDKKDFTSTTIDNKSVLLFTQAKDKKTERGKIYEIYLWVSDGNRVHNMGLIVSDNSLLTSSGLVYTNGQLFFMHRRWSFLFKTIFLTNLKDKLEGIKSLLKAWTENDRYFSQQCNKTVAQGCNFTSVENCSITSVSECNITAVPDCNITAVPDCNITPVSECNITAVPDCNITPVKECNITPVSECNITAVQHCNITLVQECNKTVAQGASSETLCFTPMPTAGLVGFLGDNGENTTWRDEYQYVNATVEDATKVPNGFRFYGLHAGAKWPVGGQWEKQQYGFARHGLTLVATVMIHNASGTYNSPLLTVGGTNVSERLGLWYGESMNWNLMIKNVKTAFGGRWENNKAHRVVLLLQTTFVAAFVDGVLIGSFFYAPNAGPNLLDIESIFIGGYYEPCMSDANAVRNMTVMNVLLYNRRLSDSELSAINETLLGEPVAHDIQLREQ